MASEDHEPMGKDLELDVIEKMCPVTEFQYTDHPHPKISFKMPGFSSNSYDRDCNPRIVAIMWMDSFARLNGFFKPHSPSGELFLDWVKLTHGKLVFGSTSDFMMTRAMYDLDIPKEDIYYEMTFGHVGKCDLSALTEGFALGEDGTKTKLFSHKFKAVGVDKVTRQPSLWPEWFKDKYLGRGCMEQAPQMRPLRKPKVTYNHQIKVQWSETDHYGHANTSSYIKWAVDALHAALLDKNRNSGALTSITNKDVRLGLARFQVCNFRECLENDQVDAHVWQEKAGEGEGQLVCCCLLKGGEEICGVKLWY